MNALNKPFDNGALRLDNRVIAAPMAGFSTAAFRELLKRHGAALAVSEMISAQALVYDNRKTWQMLDMEAEGEPLAIQLSGHEPQVTAKAAELICSRFAAQGRRLALLDLNMGCPAPKIVKNGDGAALSLEPRRAFAVAASVVRAVDGAVPVSAKLRLGWDEAHENYLEMGKGLEEAGIAALTLHARCRSQYYGGRARWEAVAALAQAVSIPVIGNGDIGSPKMALERLEQGRCAAVMIGRACLGNPWLIDACLHYEEGMPPPAGPSRQEILQAACLHLSMEIANARRGADCPEEAERLAVCAMRAHLGRYFRGLRGAAAMREAVNHLESYAEIEAYLQAHMREEA